MNDNVTGEMVLALIVNSVCYKELEKERDALQAKIKEAEAALEFYADRHSWYLHKDPVTGAEVRRSIEYFDTESGSRLDERGTNILEVTGGKRAREALAKLRGEP